MLLLKLKMPQFAYEVKKDAGSVCGNTLLSLVLIAGVMSPPLANAQLSLGGIITQSVDDSVSESVESDVQDSIEDMVEDQAVEATQDAVEEQIEEDIGLSLGGIIELQTEDQVEDQIEDELVDSVEDVVADSVEDEITDSLEEEVEDSIAEVVEESVESELEDSIEESIEESVTQNVEDSVEGAVEEQVADTVQSSVDGSVEETLASTVENRVEENVAQSVELSTAIAVEDNLETKVDDIIDRVESGLEIDESRIAKDQWLVMADPASFEALAERGYLFDEVTDLPGLGLRLAEVAAPSSFDISEVRQGVIDVVGKDRAEVDLNHIYTAGDPESSSINSGVVPRAAIVFPEDAQALPMRVGMIDSAIDTSHEVLESARIQTRDFVSSTASQPQFHGTAIASIIVGHNANYEGLAPKTELFAASVFENDVERGEIASTVSLVRALDWLVSSGVDVLNISLAGPPNRLLEAALGRATENDVIILAAAGNGGPMAQPMYPAAYDSVVAVTAVDKSDNVFRLANRGNYLDLAAPGVEIRHARAGGGFVSSSGTSFAVPFAATAAARIRKLQPATDVREQLFSSAVDLGQPGRDEVYGYGLLQPVQVLLPSVSEARSY